LRVVNSLIALAVLFSRFRFALLVDLESPRRHAENYFPETHHHNKYLNTRSS